MKESPHIIDKVFIEVNTRNMATATAVRDNIASLMEQRIFPELAKILDEWNQMEKVVRFHTLSLNVRIPADNIVNDLAENIAYKLEKAVSDQFSLEMKAALGSPDGARFGDTIHDEVEIISVEENREEQFFFFLEKGHLPWFGTKAGLHVFMQLENWKEHLERPGFLNRLINLLKYGSGVSDRFIFQVEEKQKLLFLEKVNPAIKQAAKLAQQLQTLPPDAQDSFFRFLLDVSIGSETERLQHATGQLVRVLEEISDGIISDPSGRGKAVFSDIEKTAHREEIPEIEEIGKEPVFTPEEEGVAVQNAGLFLLHPFLKSFFKAIELLDERGQIKESSLHVAIQALHFVATGDCDFFEGDLLFEKFLCGVSLAMPVKRESLLSEHTKEESRQLLLEVIRQWPALRNSSPDGLRQLFIQRNGKLVQEERNFKLLMERKAQDVLLAKLSWNSSLAKFPWRKELLFVEW